jgi:hypothetical protein
MNLQYKKSRDSLASIVNRRPDDRGSNPGGGWELFTTVPRPALGPNQQPNQWVLKTSYLGVKRPRRENNHSTSFTAEVKKCVGLYLHFPTLINGVALS